jgi:F-type H+-transporting ATPase subunit b
VLLKNFAAESSEVAEQSAEGIAAFGVNWQSLLIQAITFLLVVWVLKKFVIGKLYQIIDDRQTEINKGLEKTEQAKKALEQAQDDIDKILAEARDQAELIVSSAKSESAEIVKASEEKAAQRAQAIVTEAQSKLNTDLSRAKDELRKESAKLISEVSGIIIGQKLDTKLDSQLIEQELAKRNAK